MFRTTVLLAFIVQLFCATAQAGEAVEITIRKDVQYGDHQRHTLDVYAPSVVEPGAPVLVFFHGGGWSRGDKSALSSQGKSFAEAGVIFASANYRLFPDVVFPDFMDDAAAAVARTLDDFGTIGIGSHPLFLSGWSAGAYNAALLAYDPSHLARHGVAPGTVRGLIGLSGPYEGGFCFGMRCEHIFPEELRADWEIVRHIGGDDPPALLVAAKTDPYVPARHHQNLAAAISRAGGEVIVHVLPSGSHSASLYELLKLDSEVRALVNSFMEEAAATGLGATQSQSPLCGQRCR